jgi:signal transduction histidine kinase
MRAWSLRTTFAAATGVALSLSLVALAAFVSMTTTLQWTTTDAAAAVESVRLAQATEIELLLHDRATDPVLRRNLEETTKDLLSEAEQYVTNAGERAILLDARSQVSAYFEARRAGAPASELAAREEAAYGALEALVTLNRDHARKASAAATAWDRRADYIALAAGGLVLVVTGSFLFWLKGRAFEPVLSLADAMGRFGRGDRDARAEETGPTELREMSRRFNEMAAALATQRKAQIAFLGGVAHDLRNPLSVLKLAVALLPADQPLPPEDTLRSLIEKIARQIVRLERLAGDFIDITRIEAGQFDLRLQRLDARALVRDVVALFDGTLSKSLRVSVPDHSIELYCDQFRIEQVLTNLVSNANKYSPDESEIEVAVERRGEEVVFRVTDHGVGIPEGELGRVFEPFRRLRLSEDNIPGAGLGLFVVQQIVRAHGGKIEVESSPGTGSSFRVHLPVWRQPHEHGSARYDGPSLTH